MFEVCGLAAITTTYYHNLNTIFIRWVNAIIFMSTYFFSCLHTFTHILPLSLFSLSLSLLGASFSPVTHSWGVFWFVIYSYGVDVATSSLHSSAWTSVRSIWILRRRLILPWTSALPVLGTILFFDVSCSMMFDNIEITSRSSYYKWNYLDNRI